MKKVYLIIVICILLFSQLSFGDPKPFYIAGIGIQGYADREEVYFPHDKGYFIGGGYGFIFKERFALSIEGSGVYMPYNGDTEYIGCIPCVWPPITPIEIKSDPSYAINLNLILRITDYRPLAMLRTNKGFYLKTGFGISCLRRGELRNKYLRDDSSTYIEIEKAEWNIPDLFITFGAGFEYRISNDLALNCVFGPKININRYNPVPLAVQFGVGVRF